jgi:Alpha-mannosidase
MGSDMFFKLQRAKRMTAELEKLIYVDSESITNYKVKEGNERHWEDPGMDDSSWDTYITGNLWGGYDKHYCFRTSIVIPERFSGKVVAFNITTGFEGEWDALNPQFLFYLNGDLVQGLDVNHREVIITENAKPGEEFKIAIIAYSGLFERKSNLFTRIVVLDREIEELYFNLNVPASEAALLNESDKDRIDLLNILEKAVDMLDMRETLSGGFYRSVREANKYLKNELYTKLSNKNLPAVTAIGHTHIDVAWLWTLSQTREKAARSFSTVLNLMKQYPEYKFMSSQPQLYKYIKEDHPEIFKEIKKRVKDERWEIEGAMWLEADCNVTSGESLVRQILFGKRFFKDEFDRECRILWLPDVFGYSAALPQIMKKSGIKYFMTTKISWNQYNQLPMDTFMWRGIDGSEIFTHFITTKDYSKKNAVYSTYVGEINPDQVMGTWDRYQNKDINEEVLMSFGFGDGGGGPTKEMLENARRLKYGIPGCPVVNIDFAGNFFDRIYNKLVQNKKLHRWVGELYLEYHRGTYTSMARNKKYNRKSEFLYQDAEMLSVLNMFLGSSYPASRLNNGWETILLNQFHDILPGSSIKQVYEDSKKQYEEVISNGRDMVSAALNNIAKSIKLNGKSLIVFNTLSHNRNDIVEFDIPDECGHLDLADENNKEIPCQYIGGSKAVFYAENVPSKGYKTYRVVYSHKETYSSLYASKDVLENRFFKLRFDDSMNITSIYDKLNNREVVKHGERANVLQAFEDKPMNYDNWDIDIYYQSKMWEVNDVRQVEVSETGPVRCCLKIVKGFLSSTITQYIYLYNDVPRIDFKTCIDWKEKQVLLKAAFPVDINSNRASYEIQYGNVERDTHWNTSWDEARFEVCAHKWADLSENGYGVSILNDCKYGYDIKDSVMRLTMLKSGIYPNPDADKEYHEFTYSIYPHAGGWREGRTVEMAYNLNVPAYSMTEEAHDGMLPEKMGIVSVDKENVVIEVVKKAENSNSVILRLYECFNKRDNVKLTFFKEIEEAWECDLMENSEKKIRPNGSNIEFEIKPYEIKTFMIKTK